MVKRESEKNMQPPEDGADSTLVYRRTETPAPGNQPARDRGIAPAVTPLVIGFTLLLLVITVLGLLSVRRMDDVSFQVRSLEQQHAARLSLLLQLRLALNRLDYEARSRQDAEAHKGLLPPFELKLRTAREEVNKLLALMEGPPLSQEAKWNQFRADLESYVQVTEDLRRYSLQGFAKFGIVDRELSDLFDDSNLAQQEVFQKSEALVQRATRTIRVWSIIALLAGFLVAAGTIWEVQRRFKQMHRSMDEASRERSFSNQMLEGMVSAVVAIDEYDRIRSANSGFFEIFPGASIGASVREKFADEDAMKMLEATLGSRVEKAVYYGRWVCKSAEQESLEKTFDVYASPLAIDGGHGQIVTLVDATEAAEAERTLRHSESLAAVGQATTQVAHEIRNPLGSIRLGVSMLRDSVPGDKDALRTITLVERAIDHLNKLVVDVTTFSRQKPLERSEVDLQDLINKSLDLIADRIKEKEITIEKRFDGQTFRGYWDADQLSQVFVNVIGNAVDASPQGAPVAIATQSVSADGIEGEASTTSKRLARITISDQGGGMDQATMERMFEPFFTTKKRGTGLGLAIVKQIVEQHDGRIAAESEVGKGSRFTIDLPL
jgi:signal transduction histidine kinase